MNSFYVKDETVLRIRWTSLFVPVLLLCSVSVSVRFILLGVFGLLCVQVTHRWTVKTESFPWKRLWRRVGVGPHVDERSSWVSDVDVRSRWHRGGDLTYEGLPYRRGSEQMITQGSRSNVRSKSLTYILTTLSLASSLIPSHLTSTIKT